jgi:hypothetical protein
MVKDDYSYGFNVLNDLHYVDNGKVSLLCLYIYVCVCVCVKYKMQKKKKKKKKIYC